MGEDAEVRLRRLKLRSWRRGTREMDLLLGGFADAALARLTPAGLDAYEAVLSADDHDAHGWITGRAAVPAAHAEIVGLIRRHHGIG